MTCIKNIYSGNIDAKDKISDNESYEKFIHSFVVPDNCSIEDIIRKDYCYIIGYKGTDKTALLNYLGYYIREKECHACISFMLFNEDFNDISRRFLSKTNPYRNSILHIY